VTTIKPGEENPPATAVGASIAPAFGKPASTDDLIMVEPVAKSAVTPPAPPAPVKISPAGGNGNASILPATAAGTAAIRAPHPVIIGFEAADAGPNPAGLPGRWPALSRVRNGLKEAQRNGGGVA
jgi:hypothetical protein